LILAENYKNEKNYSRSLYYYESIKNSLDIGDLRIQQIEIKINEIKSLQLNREISKKDKSLDKNEGLDKTNNS
jgi:hypothetical protein